MREDGFVIDLIADGIDIHAGVINRFTENFECISMPSAIRSVSFRRLRADKALEWASSPNFCVLHNHKTETLILLHKRKISFICSVDYCTDPQTGKRNKCVVDNLRKFLF